MRPFEIITHIMKRIMKRYETRSIFLRDLTNYFT